MKYDIVLAGVGGQGVLSVAAVIGLAARAEGLHAKQSEVHGLITYRKAIWRWSSGISNSRRDKARLVLGPLEFVEVPYVHGAIATWVPLCRPRPRAPARLFFAGGHGAARIAQ